MIAGVPKLLLLLLGLATLCGLVIGVCATLIRARLVRRRLLDAFRAEREQHMATREQQADLTRRVVDAERSLAATARERALQVVSRHDALQMHSSLQAQRIGTLEAELSAAEERQILLQRDFATYKANKTREINLVRRGQDGSSGSRGGLTPETSAESMSVPVLNKRVAATSTGMSGGAGGPDSPRRTGQGDASVLAARGGRITGSDTRGLASHGRLGRISMPLSRELEIPALAESELPDSVEELELVLVGGDDGGAATGG